MRSFGLTAFAVLLAAASVSQPATADPADPADPARPGHLAPEIKVDQGFNGAGSHTKLQGMRGKPVVLKFWSPSCRPCVKQLPKLERLHRRYARQGLRVVALTCAKPNKVKRFLNKNQYSFPVGVDKSGVSQTRYGVYMIPATYLVGCDGRVCLVTDSLDAAVKRELVRSKRLDEKKKKSRKKCDKKAKTKSGKSGAKAR